MTPFQLIAAHSLDEAVDLLARHGGDAHALAGGTALVLLMRHDLVRPGVVVSLTGIEPLAGVRAVPDGGLEIGALTTLRDIETHPLVLARAPALADAVRRVATVRIRNQATIGGNLVHADPAQDPPPMLLAHDAIVELAGPTGRRVVPLEAFFVDAFRTTIAPDEIMVAVRIPPPGPRHRFRYVKFLPRTVDDYATVSVALRVELAPDGTVADARIALGAAGPIPLRAHAAERLLRGRHPDEELLREAAVLARDDSDPMADVRGSAAYKREMVRVWTVRALRDVLDLPRLA